ncbi:MAG: DUF1501 domain-containing protein [Planctomycetes bacterium]|nr:DUF1501 domain-containing protein [Planctomycetota bacterium]
MTKLNQIDRRRWMQSAGMGMLGVSMSGWLPALATQLAADPRRRRHCILLWMGGGPSQTDTFDMKPNHENGGEFKEIATNVPGVRFSEHLPQLAQHADRLAIIRSLSTKEGDHGRGTHLMRTGHPPQGADRYPTIGAALAKQLASPEVKMPPYVSIAPFRGFNNEAFGPGFLGPKYAPLIVGAAGMNGAAQSENFAKLKVDALAPPEGVTASQMESRLDLWKTLESRFLAQHPNATIRAHQAVYDNSLQMIESDASDAFDLSQETDTVREAYGKGMFGQGCLLARRLVERGVPFVEVSLNGASTGGPGWDTHSNNFETVKKLSGELDAGWATLMTELKQRSLLETTTIIWMGEFGRTPRINGGAGRDHFPQAWSCVLAGGGIAGGQAYGRTSADGMHVEEDKTSVGGVLATLCEALGVPPYTQNLSNTGRPIAIVDASPIERLLA